MATATEEQAVVKSCAGRPIILPPTAAVVVALSSAYCSIVGREKERGRYARQGAPAWGQNSPLEVH
jgi:hypothetical protein